MPSPRVCSPGCCKGAPGAGRGDAGLQASREDGVHSLPSRVWPELSVRRLDRRCGSFHKHVLSLAPHPALNVVAQARRPLPHRHPQPRPPSGAEMGRAHACLVVPLPRLFLQVLAPFGGMLVSGRGTPAPSGASLWDPLPLGTWTAPRPATPVPSVARCTLSTPSPLPLPRTPRERDGSSGKDPGWSALLGGRPRGLTARKALRSPGHPLPKPETPWPLAAQPSVAPPARQHLGRLGAARSSSPRSAVIDVVMQCCLFER